VASDYHEPFEILDEQSRDLHRALISLKEEIEAADWYHQRVVACRDETLAKVLAHNRNEEIEHACMTLEWLRRNSPEWAERMGEYLFREGEITQESQASGGEAAKVGGGDLRSANASSLGIGSLKGKSP
jgi:ferritin-like protein